MKNIKITNSKIKLPMFFYFFFVLLSIYISTKQFIKLLEFRFINQKKYNF